MSGPIFRRRPAQARTVAGRPVKPAFASSRQRARARELAPELGGVAAALGPAAVKEGSVSIEHPTTARLLPERGMAEAQPAPHRLAIGAEQGGDAADGHAGCAQPGSVLVARLPAGGRRLTGPLGSSRRAGGRWRLWHHCSGVGQLVGDLTRGAACGGAMPVGQRLHGRAQVAQQVPPVGDLIGEGLARAGRGEAAEPPRLHAQRHGPTLPGQLAEGAFVSAVDALGRPATTRA